MFAHRKLREDLKHDGITPRLEILKYGLTESEAFLVESTTIDLIDVTKLYNKVRGHGSKHGSRGTTEEIVSLLDAKEVTISEPSILININRQFHYGMTPQELYDATRSAWRVNPTRKEPKYAMSVFRGVVREVYEIAAWFPGGTTMRASDGGGLYETNSEKWEFVGKTANRSIRNKYLGLSVVRYYKAGAQNPIKYVNC